MHDDADPYTDPHAEIDRLRSQIALCREALEHMHQGLCLFDAEGRIALCNGRYAEVLQLPRDKIRPGMSARDLIELGMAAGYYGDGQTADELERHLWANLQASPAERGTLVRGGRTYAVLPDRTSTGHWVATFEDITARIEAENALRESEALMRAILDTIPDCVKIFDEAGTLQHINPKGLELLQAPDIESLSRPGYIAVPPEYLDGCLDVHRRVIAGESVVWTYEVIGLEGRRRHVEAHAVPFRLPDGARAHMCISRDIDERKHAEDALRRSEERLRLVHEATGLADFEAGPDGIARVSERFAEQTGLPPGTTDLPLDDWLRLVHPDDRERLHHTIAKSLENADAFSCEFRIIRPDTGEVRWISSRTKMERNEAGEAIRSIGAHIDITEQKRVEQALRESEERFRLAAEAAGLGVWDYDMALDRRQWSDRLHGIFGIAPHVEPSLEALEACIHPADRAKFKRMLEHARAADLTRFEAALRIRRANDGAERWVAFNGWRTYKAASRLRRIIMTVRDVTDEKTAEERVRWTASHDPLTRLANRSLFQETLDQAIRAAAVEKGVVGLVLLDMDHFKQINDTLGHDAGDMLLKMFAERLRGVVRAQDTVARFGGDEFAIVVPEIEGEQSLLQLTGSLQDRLREPFVHEGRLLDCRVSMGASLFPQHGRTPEQLLKNADVALYAAKAAGRGQVSLFEPRMRDEVQRRASMVQLARNALRDDRIVPYYQPKLDLRTGALTGFEALLRWRKPRGGIGTPASLEAAFEDLEVAAAISDRMIERVIADMRGWLDKGVPFGNVAINASAAEFRRDTFAERLLEQLLKAKIPTRLMQLEVTETVFLGRGAEYVHRALSLLHARGVTIALDDFGTGYASLRHLKQFPVDMIKIDQSFVRGMASEPGDAAIIHAVINLGRSLGIGVVAEGIETEAQARRLIELGCEYGQGYLFSKAVSARRVPALVAAGGAAPEQAAKGPLRLVANRS